jgi:hypothetical protein
MGVSCGDDPVNSLKGVPLVLFADVVLLAEIDEVSDGLGGQQGEAVDDLNLRGNNEYTVRIKTIRRT